MAAGNTSLAGVRLLEREKAKQDEERKLSEWDIWNRLEEFAGKTETFQLAEEPEFDKVYVGYMNFDVG